MSDPEPAPAGPAIPVWLLDVDGTLNAFAGGGPDLGWGDTRVDRVQGPTTLWTLRWAPPLLDRIRALLDAGLVEIRWCTTWTEQVRILEELLDLPALPVEVIPGPGELNQDAKIAAALAVLAAGRPLVWADDNAIPEPGEAGWDDAFEAPGAPRLFITPEPTHGLQPEHLDAIERFLAGIAAGAGQPVGAEA